MTPRIGSALVSLAAVLLAGTGLKAEDTGLSTAFKVRALVGSTASDRGLANEVLGHNLATGAGFGLELGYGLGKGKITGELGYTFISGDARQGNPSDMATSGTNVTVSSWVDSRKNKMEGLHLRVGYEAPLSDNLSWRAGLQFGGNKYSHQVLGNINGTSGAGKFADAYTYVGSKSSMTPSPYGGLTYAFDRESALEFGVSLLQYSSINYQHVINTKNQLDTAPTTNRVLPAFEVAYVFRF